MSKIKIVIIALLSFLIVLIILIVIWGLIKPSNDKDWSEDQKILSYAKINDNLITIYNIRNFTYENTTKYYSAYYNETFDLEEIDSMWYVVEPFSGLKGSAHTFLSFGFNDKFVAISVEIRKEKGEFYSPIKGLFKKYEIMYVWGDEKDLIKLRSNFRHDEVFVYPINTTKDTMQKIFKDIINRTNNLKEEPEFYNTLTNTCTTNIAKHVNHIKKGRVPFSFKILFPAYSDELAYKLGIINTTLSFEDARKHFNINKQAEKYANSSDFSLRIRDFLE